MQAKVFKEVIDDVISPRMTSGSPLLLSLSSFSGSGQHAHHSLGKYQSGSWNSLEYGLVGLINMGMFGVPLTGPEVSCAPINASKVTDED